MGDACHARQAAELVAQMTLEQKASLMSGRNFWYLKGIEELGLESIMVTDGPHGVRKQLAAADSLGIEESVPATCFPTAAALACSFDPELLYEIGVALGEECRTEDVAVLLGPGLNIKRSPLCGRNFEYFSEDPYLSGKMAAALARGVQSQNVGACLKHFAANNQETRRMTTTSVIDERALREIYLLGFEIAVREAKPWTVMCSYNRLFVDFNSTDSACYASDNHALLTGILREEWGFDGLVVSDWGAVNDRVAGVHAGLDLEMPGIVREGDEQIVAAVRAGTLAEEELDCCAQRVVELVLKAREREAYEYDKNAHHVLARETAARCAVLLKNEGGILPCSVDQKIALVGAFAQNPRYQGTGSSKINPNKLDTVFAEFVAAGIEFDYADGYRLDSDVVDETLIAEACSIAEGKEVVCVVAGLPDSYESEGFDRTDMHMPPGQKALIERLWTVNRNIVVMLATGSCVEIDWDECARAIVLGYLGGEAGAGGITDVVLGKANPSARLAETWPVACADNPSFQYFIGYPRSVEYRESIFVGYRYYDTAQKPVLYPFGHGLSYTEFEYTNLVVDKASFCEGDTVKVSVDVTNVGERVGAEVVQLYVSNRAAYESAGVFCAEQELKRFERVELDAGQTATVHFELDARAFEYFNTAVHAWCLVTGERSIRIGSSSRDIRLATRLAVISTVPTVNPNYATVQGCYGDLSDGINVSDEEFRSLFGRELPQRDKQAGEEFTRNSTLLDIQEKWVGRMVTRFARKKIATIADKSEDMRAMAEHMLMEAPLRAALMAGDEAAGITPRRLDGLIDVLNGRILRGLGKIVRG